MSITINTIRVSIGGVPSSGFDINLGGTTYRFGNFTLNQSLLSPNSLSFMMHKLPEEEIGEAQFQVCGEIIGKEITVEVETDNVEHLSFNSESDNTAEISFKGIIIAADGMRERTEYDIHVQAMSGEFLLMDNPTCKSFEQMTLADIVSDVLNDYDATLNSRINTRYQETIPYCVQYNETNYQFLQRLAQRYGEWMFNDGTHFVFGELDNGESVHLSYPSHDIPSYQVNLQIQPTAFNHVASSYSKYDSTKKEGLEEMQRPYNALADETFSASTSLYSKQTFQNLHSGGFADDDGRENLLKISTKTQARGTKASMATYSGTTYCSKLRIGSRLVITDNYLIQGHLSNEKSQVEQDEILIVEMTHCFSEDEVYTNHFTAIPVACDYPPYANTDVYPVCPSCRAKVTDNEDPLDLGRIRVQFDWQAQQEGEMMTPWLRIVQPYAGAGKGFSFIPEKGEEVMVCFEGGNADRPYVTGTLFNGVDNPDGAWLANSNQANQIKAIRTRNGHTIEIHDEGENGYIRIYDNEKENYVLTFSTDEKLIRLESTGNIELYAQNDIIMRAGHNIDSEARNDINTQAGHNINTSADNDIFSNASNDFFDSAGHDMQRTAENDIREHAGNDRNAHIGRNDSLSVNENQFITIGDNKDEQVEHKLQITAENIRTEAKDELLEYSKIHHIKAEKEAVLNADNEIDIKAGIVKVN